MQDIESSRSYIDELYSPDSGKVAAALVTLKNSVIGSNRQKNSVIEQGVVPRLLQIMSDEALDPNIRLDATITIGTVITLKSYFYYIFTSQSAVEHQLIHT